MRPDEYKAAKEAIDTVGEKSRALLLCEMDEHGRMKIFAAGNAGDVAVMSSLATTQQHLTMLGILPPAKGTVG